MNKRLQHINPGYDVGYGKPPIEHQFKKGQTGNPKGRPKGSRNKPKDSISELRKIVLDEAFREVSIQEDGQTIRLPIVQAALRSLAIKSVKGNVPATKLLFEFTDRAEKEALEEKLEILQFAERYKEEGYATIAKLKAEAV